MNPALRLLLVLFTILSSTTIAGASVQATHAGVVFGKADVREGETHFSASFIAAGTGGRTWTHGYSQIADDAAEAAYQSIRGSTTDVAAISRYTGYKPERLQRIKDYLFSNKEWTGADGHIAAAWHRLRTGRGTDTDKLLLKHETCGNVVP